MKTSELKTEFIKELLACKGTERGLGAFRILRDAAPSLAAEVVWLRGLLADLVDALEHWEEHSDTHAIDCPGEEECSFCRAKKHLTDTEG